jgi:hypothetical protein
MTDFIVRQTRTKKVRAIGTAIACGNHPHTSIPKRPSEFKIIGNVPKLGELDNARVVTGRQPSEMHFWE